MTLEVVEEGIGDVQGRDSGIALRMIRRSLAYLERMLFSTRTSRLKTDPGLTGKWLFKWCVRVCISIELFFSATIEEAETGQWCGKYYRWFVLCPCLFSLYKGPYFNFLSDESLSSYCTNTNKCRKTINFCFESVAGYLKSEIVFYQSYLEHLIVNLHNFNVFHTFFCRALNFPQFCRKPSMQCQSIIKFGFW